MTENEGSSTSGEHQPPASGGAEKGESRESENAYQKLLTEKKNLGKKNAELEQRLKEIELNASRAQEAQLSESKKFEELAALRAQQLKELEAKLASKDQEITTYKDREVTAIKMKELNKELRKLGVKEDYLSEAVKLVSLDRIKFDPELNMTYGVDAEALDLKKRMGVLFENTALGVDKSAPNANSKAKTDDSAYAQELSKCKTQKEFDAVRMKFGKL